MKRTALHWCSSAAVFCCAMMLFSPSAFAADDSISFVQVQFALTADNNANNIANIGDQVTVFVVLNNADGGCVAQSTQVEVDLSAYGGPGNQALNCGADNGGVGDQFAVQFNIQDGGGSAIDVAANNPASQVQVTATDADENDGAGNPNPTQNSNPLGDGVIDTTATNGVDTDAPQVNDGAITATLVTDNGQAGVAGVGDVLKITYTPLTDGINDPNPAQILAALNAVGGSANQQLFDDGTNGDDTNADGIFSFELTITEGAGGGIDAAGLNVGIMMEDDAGNNSGATVNDGNTFSVDNVSPTVTDGNITVVIQTDNNTDGIANQNDVLRITWDNSGGGDNNTDTLNTFQADLSAFGGSATQQLFDDGSNGDQTGADGIYSFDLTVPAGVINASNLNGSVSITDNGGNTTQANDTSNIAVNNTTDGSSSGGRRRQSLVQEEPTTTEVESTDPVVNISNEEVTACGCEEQKENLDLMSDYLFDSYTNSPYTLMCIDPSCFDIDPESNENLTDVEKNYAEALKKFYEASQASQDGLDKVIKAKKAEEDAQGDFGEKHFDYLGVLHEGVRTGETNQSYGQRKTDAKKARAEAEQKAKDARTKRYQEEERYRQAQRAFDEAKTQKAEARKAVVEESGVERARQMEREAIDNSMNKTKSSCLDPVCAGNPYANSVFMSEWTTAKNALNACLDNCGKSPVSTYTTPSDTDGLDRLFTSEEDIQRDVQSITETRLIPEDMGPFSPISGDQEFLLGSSFANDIAGNPAEPFIIDLYSIGAVNGEGSGRQFNPMGITNRAALLKVGYNTFGIEVPTTVTNQPFVDIPLGEWYTPFFNLAAIRGDVTGYDADQIPNIIMREARPAQETLLVEGLAMFTRIGDVDLNMAYDYQSEVVDGTSPAWWHPVWNWAEMYAIVSSEPLLVDESDALQNGKDTIDGSAGNDVIEGDEPGDKVSRAKMAEIAVKIHYTKKWVPCNCDEEKKAHEDAQQKAKDAQEKADADQAKADASEEQAQQSEADLQKAQEALDELDQYFDDSSSATGDDDVTITTGDLRLMELAKQLIDQQVADGEKSQVDGQKEKEGINKDALPELRERRDELYDIARENYNNAKEKAESDRAQADADAQQAEKSQEEADKAAEEEAEAKKAYEECLKKCEIINKKWAEQQRRLEAERKRKAEQRRREAERKRQEEERRRQQEAANNPPPSAGGGSSDRDRDGGIPPAAKDPCKEKFLQAVAARGKQVAEARPDEVADFDPNLKTVVDVTTGLGELIAAAAQAAAQGGQTTVQIASGLAALPQMVYGFWIDYVGSAALQGGKAVLGGRICQAYQVSTTGKCGYEVLDGQVVYWQRDGAGNMSVVIMGPGDDVTRQQCSK